MLVYCPVHSEHQQITQMTLHDPIKTVYCTLLLHNSFSYFTLNSYILINDHIHSSDVITLSPAEHVHASETVTQ